ncbi:hypothetical protein PoB_002059600 [Plakobranchus ocellatus]|uniref:Uncharacterized protein n=1 Tax=Plakobranchus ocellatus TaxID=259542 RepID=A0AAV3ZHI3_9GAST|nr:hypothetical protein PoB_002059600 [Plakobranchus ocellatus]
MSGWNLPLIPDENDIVAWVKREKNGENKKKPRRDEEVPEEAFRHMFSRCCSLENQMEFERESLVQRYRKHCQFGPLVHEKTRLQSSTEKPSCSVAESKETVPNTPSGGLRYPRSCKSAEVPGTPKVSTLQQIGLGDEDIESLIPTRSHSVIDDSKLRAYGLTLPPDEKTAKLLELAGKFIARADHAATAGITMSETRVAQACADDKAAVTAEEQQDEGYDSKISSNDADAGDEEEEGSRVVQVDTASEKTNLDSEPREAKCEVSDTNETAGWTECSRVVAYPAYNQTAVFQSIGHFGRVDTTRPQPQTMPQYQAPTDSGRAAIAKLMYSQRDRNLYERTPNRRMRQNGFRYAGKEQSRLMETSLNHITPGYLSLHQFANLSNFVQYPIAVHEQQNQIPHQQQQQQQENYDTKQQQNDQSSNSIPLTNNTPSRTLAMRKICLQDSNSPDNHHFSLEAKSQSSETPTASPEQEPNAPQPVNFLKRSEIISPPSAKGAQCKMTEKPDGALANSEANKTNCSFKPKDSQDSDSAGAAGSAQVLKSDEIAGTSSRPRQTSGSNREAQGTANRYHHAPDATSQSYPRRTSQTTIPSFRSKILGSGHRSERLSTTCFPVADLLPAVEKSLRKRGRRGLSRNQQQLLYRSQTTLLDGSLWKQSDQAVSTSYPDNLNYSSSLGNAGMATSDATMEVDIMRSPRLQFQPGESILRTAGGMSLLVHHKSVGPPGFRPHNSLSPLQRAKDIVNRRLHGHITHLPDGAETVQVTSPQYQNSRMDRINSASRCVALIIGGGCRVYGLPN